MPKYYTTMRMPMELHKKIVRLRAKLEFKTGQKHTLISTVDEAIDALMRTSTA